ncbi:amino acid adenylation domain-containing protein [Pseudomonas trivialis]|uniref:Amino acid adenylation domain-containing protein n=1 Tax=Pseudomonas trivialis TaxID=200450 RepID=A0ABY0TZE7_9PSED|nr:amino acid adenylation domain-containing protein [Pseudomonas trivialis]SDR81481.1 amino acid adenylation domain-containing protein [Pseudomonas trivialis]
MNAPEKTDSVPVRSDNGAVGESLVIERFFNIAATSPDTLAAKDSVCELSYGQLARLVKQLACGLRERGVMSSDFVAVEMTPSVDLIAVLLAVQLCGAAYVPLDKSAPVQRNTAILCDCNPRLIVGEPDSSLRDEKTFIPASQLVQPDTDGYAFAAVGSHQRAYVIYTSGTTGRPKGVPITHGNVAALFEGTQPVFQFNHADIVVLYHSYAFDFSVWEISSALGFGGKLLIPTTEIKLSPDRFAAFIKTEQVTVLNQTPSAFAINAESLVKLPVDELALRFIIFGGERLNPSTLRNWFSVFGDSRPALVNMYGITEVTVHATLHILTQKESLEPSSVIGKPLPGFSYQVLKESPNTVGGELILSGPQVADGYLNRPELTAERFIMREGYHERFYRSGDLVDVADNGDLIYIGRADQQVKINGYRIELGDIESTFEQVADVLEVCVLPFKDAEWGDYLFCCFSSSSDEASTVKQLKQRARKTLPGYMHPLRYKKIPVFPKTVNGKVDKRVIKNNLEGL